MLPSLLIKKNIQSLHGTCIAVHNQGVLLTGKPGIGKSTIALNALNRGYQLISDDLTTIEKSNDQWVASCPPTIKNLMHVRNIGFINVANTFGTKAIKEAVTLIGVIHLKKRLQEIIMIRRKIVIQNKLGLHARASMKLINVAGRFESDIVIKHGSAEVNAKSIMNVMALAASKGTEIELITHGNDEQEAMAAVANLIENRFDENE